MLPIPKHTGKKGSNCKHTVIYFVSQLSINDVDGISYITKSQQMFQLFTNAWMKII